MLMVQRQAVAAVLSNWHNVLRAINMASSKGTQPICRYLPLTVR